MTHGSLFSGFGAADLAATWMGWNNAFWCEIDEFPRTVLKYWFPNSKAYGNIKETDFSEWRGKIDVLTGGFPCQPFSVAGQRKGKEDDRYLWPEMLRAIREIQPTWIVGENVGGILSMVQPGGETTVESQADLFEASDKETILEQEYVVESICRDLEQEGYSVQPLVIPACAVGAPHRRDRIFFIAHRADTGFKDLQQVWKNGICQLETSSYAKCKGSGQVFKEIQPRQPDGHGFDSVGGKRTTTNSNDVDGYLSGLCTSRISQFKSSRVWINSDATSKRLQRNVPQDTKLPSELFRNFPTQSPICRGNDGLPSNVVRLTIPFTKWRKESVKGYGNAIVPQVMYEIFKAIKQAEKAQIQ